MSISDGAKARQDTARRIDGTFGHQTHAEPAGGSGTLAAPHPAAAANREAMADVVGMIQWEHGAAMTLVLTENGHDNGLSLHKLNDEHGWAYGLDDEDSLWHSLQPIDTTDPNWHQGTAEPVTLDGGRSGWRIDVTAANRILG